MSIMSTISFPNPHSRDTPSSAGSHSHTNSGHVNFFPSSYDPQASASSFQINPLSSHPPRTPRTSIITTSLNAYPREIYSSTEEAEEKPLVMGNDDDDEEDEERLESRAGSRVRKEEVWREVLSTSTGRDKALKLIQYSMRVYLLFHASMRSSPLASKSGSHPRWEVELFKRFDATMSGLSLTRKCLILFNWLTPLNTITAPQPLPYASASKMGESTQNLKKAPPPPFLHTFLHAPPPVLLDLLNSLSDDVATFSKLGLIGKRIGERAGKLADWCWFSGTLVGLVEVGVEQGLVKNLMEETEARLFSSTFADGVPPIPGTSPQTLADERELEKLRRQYYWLRISRAKLLMDLIFVSYECFKFQRGRRPVMGLSGLTSAILSTMKLYDRHRTVLMKAASVHT
ncbi:hypothetical protein K439DRAFT_1378642 [Ramaria rubella]|nr:hypothetical protein K439DRAFT_1378642 [Ramaria rubella]